MASVSIYLDPITIINTIVCHLGEVVVYNGNILTN